MPKRFPQQFGTVTSLLSTDQTLIARSGSIFSTTMDIVGGYGNAFVTVGTTGSGAQYICDGVADDVQINEALTFASINGTNVLILPGTYTCAETIYLYSNVDVSGSGKSTIITCVDNFAYPGNGRDIIRAKYDSLSYVTLKNLRIDGNGSNQTGDGDCIRICHSSETDPDAPIVHKNITLDNIDVINSRGQGIHVKETDGLTISNCYIYGCGVGGLLYHNIYIRNSINCRMINCISNDSYGSNIQFTDCEDVIIDNNNVNRTLLTSRGIRVAGRSKRVSISNNIVNDILGVGIMTTDEDGYTPENIVIDGNIVVGSTEQGIYGRRFKGCIINSNIVENAGLNAIQMKYDAICERCVITSNVIRNVLTLGESGIALDDLDRVIVVGNSITDVNTIMSYGINANGDYIYSVANVITGYLVATDSINGTGIKL